MYQLEVSVVIETIDEEHKKRVIEKLLEANYEIEYTNQQSLVKYIKMKISFRKIGVGTCNVNL